MFKNSFNMCKVFPVDIPRSVIDRAFKKARFFQLYFHKFVSIVYIYKTAIQSNIKLNSPRNRNVDIFFVSTPNTVPKNNNFR